MSLKFGRIQPWTAELAALTNLKNLLLENYSKYFDDLLSGERSLPFGQTWGNCNSNCNVIVMNYIFKVMESNL